MGATNIILGLAVLAVFLSVSEAQCQAGWKTLDRACYYFEQDLTKPWDDAEAHCVSLGGHLASLHSDEEHEFVVGFLAEQKHYWIGLTDNLVENTFIWSDDSPRDYTKWYTGEPNNYKKDEDCVEYHQRKWGNRWNDRTCSTQLNFICKTQDIDECALEETPCLNGGTCIDGIDSYTCDCARGFEGDHCGAEVQCQADWKKLDGACYYFEQDLTKPWDDAEAHCVSLGGHLVSLHSDEEQEFVVGFLAEQKHYWIGLTDNLVENAFIWSDFSPRDYTKWYTGEPNNYKKDEDCAEFHQRKWGNGWNDRTCSTQLNFICKKPRVA